MILHENESGEKPVENTQEYIATDDEKKLIKKIMKCLEKSKKHREKYDKEWLWYYKMFRGKQWKHKRPSYRHSEVINMIFQNIQASVPILVDTQPRIEFAPQEPNDLEFSEILNEIAAHDQERGNWLMELLATIYDSKFYGVGFLETGYDEELFNELGGCTFESADPFYCFPDPNARKINDNGKRSTYFIYAEPMDLDSIKRKFPNKGKFVKSDLIDLMNSDKTDLGEIRFISPVDNKTVLESERDLNLKDDDRALVITCWKLDTDYDELKKEDGTFEQKLKFPNGRKTVIAGQVVLEDMENPFDHGQFPYSKLLNYMLPREFWGISDIEQLESPQNIFNKLVSYALDVLILMGNPVWIIPTSTGIDTDNLENRPGEVIEFDGSNAPTRLPGVDLQPFVFGLIDRMKKWFDDISGSQEVSRGARPEGVDTGIVVSKLQEAAQTRLRLQSRMLDACLQDAGQQYVQNVLQFYKTPRIIRLTGKENSSAFFKISIEDRPHPENPQETQKVAIVSEPGQEPAISKEYVIRGNFDVKIITGSSLPFAKAEKSNLSFKLFEAGASDEEQLLKDVDHPERAQILQRLEKKKQEQMQAEQQAAMAKQGVPAG